MLGVGLAGAALAGSAAGSAAGYRFEAIEGGAIDLAELAGGPVLVVNTASRFGFSGHYNGLQALHERYRDRGLTVIGVPSDSFGQELGDEAAVKEFCEVNFGIDFPLTEITPVRGKEAHPFHKGACEEGAEPTWNFYKILLDGEGRIAASFGERVEPDSPQLVAAIEALLAGEEVTSMEPFTQLGQFFHQDVFVIYENVPAAISDFIAWIGVDRTKHLGGFLEHILASKSDAELEQLWDETGSDIYVLDGDTRKFLALVYEELKKDGR